MSKVDAMRALREARMSAQAKATPASPTAARAVAAKAPASRSVSRTPAPEAAVEEATPELCGHRNMGGKSCTRPAGHSEKNHRYG